ncbi:hypothetical protein E2C01_061548 [Portunus trituberculatus]|uniref:Uncharacterized protein n=1 Tax=Portunus trituberculatus TaxID=210409 RepID=A0A5B7HB94_PORTR|nr:hypothetical protein [Portunus trituberculatus]
MEFEAFLYTTAAVVMPHHCLAAQMPQCCHLPARRTQVQQGRRRHTSSAEGRHYGGGKCQQAGSSGHCSAKSSPGPICVMCHSDATALAVQVLGTVDGCLCPLVVDTGTAKTFVREKVAAQDLPVSDWQLCGLTGHCTTL